MVCFYMRQSQADKTRVGPMQQRRFSLSLFWQFLCRGSRANQWNHGMHCARLACYYVVWRPRLVLFLIPRKRVYVYAHLAAVRHCRFSVSAVWQWSLASPTYWSCVHALGASCHADLYVFTPYRNTSRIHNSDFKSFDLRFSLVKWKLYLTKVISLDLCLKVLSYDYNFVAINIILWAILRVKC